MSKFNYEEKVWGAPAISVSPFYIQGLKLKYTLEDLIPLKGKVLDVGCGGGNMAKAIKQYRPDLDVYGADISKQAIKDAQKNPQGVHFTRAKGEKLPYKDNTFDMVVMYDVLEHLHHPEVAIKEVKRVLKKNGVFHVFSPLDGQPFTLPWIFYRSGWKVKDKHTGHVQLFSDKSFTTLLETHGLHVKKRLFSFHYFFQIFDVAYFSLLDLFHMKVGSSIEGLLSTKKKTPLLMAYELFYKTVVMLGHYESRMLKHIPGAGGHYTAVLKR